MKIFKFICLIFGFIWTTFALCVLIGDYELSKVNTVCACGFSGILFFMFSAATYSIGGGDR
jgi:hypothetical protein